MSAPESGAPTLLYCHCRYAQIVPAEVKAGVLEALCKSELPFEAVPDLCEASARRDPSLRRLAASGRLKIAACYPRAVKWLFSAAGAALPADGTEVVNMRVRSAEDVVSAMMTPRLEANLPTGKVTEADAPTSATPT